MTTRLSIVYWVLSLSYLLTLSLGNYPFDYLHKALPVLLLMFITYTHLKGNIRWFISAALLCSATGDILLASEVNNNFMLGLAAFAGAHICYTCAFLQWRQWRSWQLWPLLVLALASIAVLAVILPASGALQIPVLVYMAIISCMAISAILASSSNKLFISGALLFVFSDSLIAINKFVTSIPFEGYLIMLSYYLAQYYLTTASVKQGNNVANS